MGCSAVEKEVPLKHWYPRASPHGVTNKKTNVDIIFIMILLSQIM
jgi:hypothetical protein